MDILTFWELTPYEFGIILKEHYKKAKEEQEEKITLAYMTALWTAQWTKGRKKPDSLQKILGDKPKQKMTDEQMYEKVKLLHKAFGGE